MLLTFLIDGEDLLLEFTKNRLLQFKVGQGDIE